MKNEKSKNSGIGVVVKATSRHASRVVNLNELPAIITGQWRKAQDGLLEILKFGVMLMEVKAVVQLDNSPRGNQHREGNRGLRGWLSENCPEVNYFTARGYMAAAEGLKTIAEIKRDVPLLALMGDVDPREEKAVVAARERIMKTLAGASLRLLKEAGRHAASAHPAEPGQAREGKQQDVTQEQEAGEAWEKVVSVLGPAMAWRFYRHLPLLAARHALEEATLLRDGLDQRVQELRGASATDKK